MRSADASRSISKDDGNGSYKLPPIVAVGSGAAQDKQQALLAEIIEKVNGLFEGQLTDGDQLRCVKRSGASCWKTKP